MAIQYDQALLLRLENLQRGVTDEFKKSDFLMNALPFHTVTSPVGGGNAWVYSYNRLTTQPTAQFRAVNTEYTPGEVTWEKVQTELKILGAAFQVDSVFRNNGGAMDIVTLQMAQKVKALRAMFTDCAINGDSSVDPLQFDGLNKTIADAQVFDAGSFNLSTTTNVKKNKDDFMAVMDAMLYSLDGTPGALLTNTAVKLKLIALAREYGLYTNAQNSFGQWTDSYRGVPIVDVGAKSGTNDPIVATDGDGYASIYAVRFGLDGFHGLAAPYPGGMISVTMPDFGEAKNVHQGQVEMVGGVALEATKAAAKMKNVKVAPTTTTP